MTKKHVLIGALFITAIVVGIVVFIGTNGVDPMADAKGVVIDTDDSESVALGHRLYTEHCAACHGESLEGEPRWKTRKDDGLMPAPPHDDTGHTWHHPDQHLFALTKHGIEAVIGQEYESAMPAYRDVLDDNEIIAVLAYIKSQWPAEIRARHDQMNAMWRRRNP